MQPSLDLALIDDDALIRRGWEHAAARQGKRIATFASPAAFLAQSPALPKATPIYVDRCLGHGVDGIRFAKSLYDRGYTALYLATGAVDESAFFAPWFVAIVDKEPPF